MKKIIALLLMLCTVLSLVGCKNALTGFGSYECGECGHIHEPSNETVFWALHMGTSRKLTCPECGETSWQKYVEVKE